MTGKLFGALILASCWVTVFAGAASAQQNCPEGKTWNGDCVNPGLAATTAQTGSALAQPRISQTSSPILPTNDWSNRYPLSR
jgi:hypothetical protein